jgi:hypothetical protein
MIEIELSALARQFLNRHIPSQARLAQEVLALVQECPYSSPEVQCRLTSARVKSDLTGEMIGL